MREQSDKEKKYLEELWKQNVAQTDKYITQSRYVGDLYKWSIEEEKDPEKKAKLKLELRAMIERCNKILDSAQQTNRKFIGHIPLWIKIRLNLKKILTKLKSIIKGYDHRAVNSFESVRPMDSSRQLL